jgi:hypothetical protein
MLAFVFLKREKPTTKVIRKKKKSTPNSIFIRNITSLKTRNITSCFLLFRYDINEKFDFLNLLKK